MRLDEYSERDCPFCGENHDDLMDRPALESFGWNHKSGILFRCNACGQRVAEAQIVTGKTDILEAAEETGGPPTSYEEYKNATG